MFRFSNLSSQANTKLLCLVKNPLFYMLDNLLFQILSLTYKYMKVFILLLSLSLIHHASSVSCYVGYYDPGGATRCMQCPPQFSICTSATSGTYHSRISGYLGTAGVNMPYCPSYTIGATIPTVYNKQTNSCQLICKTGCLTCSTDYDFCTSCQNGYVWNTDYTCIPAVLGLEAATLGLLVIGLLFAIIGCCYVNKARNKILGK